jgi:hypothetical protein
MGKRCGVCGETVVSGAIECPKCGRGVFEPEKLHSDSMNTLRSAPSTKKSRAYKKRQSSSFWKNLFGQKEPPRDQTEYVRLNNELKDLVGKTIPSKILWSESSFGPIPLIKTDTRIQNRKQLEDTDVSPLFRAFIKENTFALYVIIDFPKVGRQFVFEIYDPDPKKLKLFFAMILKLKILTFSDEPYFSTGIGVPIRDVNPLVEMLRKLNLA